MVIDVDWFIAELLILFIIMKQGFELRLNFVPYKLWLNIYGRHFHTTLGMLHELRHLCKSKCQILGFKMKIISELLFWQRHVCSRAKQLFNFISLLPDSYDAGFQVECPKYPGFCLAQQQRKREREIQMEKGRDMEMGAERKLFEYPFIETYYSPHKVSSVLSL